MYEVLNQDYMRVVVTPGQWCFVYKEGANFSPSFLYNFHHFILLVHVSSDFKNIEVSACPDELEVISDFEACPECEDLTDDE